MLQIFLIIAFGFTFGQLAVAADNKTVQSMDEINADLEAKKAAMEPFDPRKVKVDVESLGLDDVDKKAEPPKEEPKKEEIKKEEPKKEEVPVEKPEAEKSAQPTTQTPDVEGMLTKIQQIIKKSTETAQQKIEEIKPQILPKQLLPTAEKTADSEVKADKKNKKSTEKYLNSQKKKSLKKRIDLEAQRKENEKRQKEKLKKLNELREKYVREAGQNEGADDEFNTSEKIIPQKKNLNRYVTEEMPALPILNRFRTADNNHIPIVLTPKERIEILFGTISIGSVSAFNDAYRDIQNPDAINQSGDTILTYALLLRKYPVIASVLAKGANPNLPNRLGYTPINIAIELVDFKSLELLANNKADLNYYDAFGRTYLMHAARVGFLPAADLLISRGVDINAMDNDGFTALSIAYRHKKEIIVQYLLKNGAKTWVEKPYDPEKQSLIKELENRWK